MFIPDDNYVERCAICTITLPSPETRFGCVACSPTTFQVVFCRHCSSLHQNAHKYRGEIDRANVNPLDPEPAQPRYLNYDHDPLVRTAIETLEAIELNRDFQGELYRNYTAALREALDIGPKVRLPFIYRDIFAQRRTGNPSPTP